jgi:hypothetical protein
MIVSRIQNTPYNADDEIAAYRKARSVRSDGTTVAPREVKCLTRMYKAIVREDKYAFKELIKQNPCNDVYAMFDKYSVMRAALSHDSYFLEYFINNVDKPYRGKLHQAVTKLVNVRIDNSDKAVHDVVDKAIAGINAIEPINWGIWNSKIINDSLGSQDYEYELKNGEQMEPLFRFFCENGAYFTKLNPITERFITNNLSRWYSDMSQWPSGTYFEHEKALEWISAWLKQRNLSPVEVLPQVEDADKKVFLMRLLIA